MRKQTGRVASKVYFTDVNVRRVRARARSLRLPVSTYLAILLRNAVYRGEPRVEDLVEPDSRDAQVRQEVPLSLPADLHADADAFASRLSGTISRLLETLAEADSVEKPLIVWPVR